MTIRVALNHITTYTYDRPIELGPQTIRLRPAPHCRTPIRSYSLDIQPESHFLNWQQDPHGNFLARAVFPDPVTEFRVQVDLVADMVSINPFDFFVEDAAEDFPFEYAEALATDLRPWLLSETPGPALAKWLETVDRTPRRTVQFLVDLNQRLQEEIGYVIRMEPGVQTCEQTLQTRSGSCRDSAWLLVQILRQHGLAARFVSGYLVQLRADVASLDGPSGPEEDFTDLHAWAEVYLPGAGWIGLDPTSGLMAGEGHIPVACSPNPVSAAPISGTTESCNVDFDFTMSLERVHEDPRVTKPYTEQQWTRINTLGHAVDERLRCGDVRLTMGGEPTFVSIDDMEGDEWNTAAVGEAKQRLSVELVGRLRDRFAPGGLLHYGQGKWYPGEPLPRWAYTCLWRIDGEPIWSNPDLLASPTGEADAEITAAESFLQSLADRLDVDHDYIRAAYEDVWEVVGQEQRLPVDVDPRSIDADDDDERRRLAAILERGVNSPAGYVLPLHRAWWQSQARWTSSEWPFRSERLFLVPGDSPLGLRLPLERLPALDEKQAQQLYVVDPFANRDPLPGYQEIRNAQAHIGDVREVPVHDQRRGTAGSVSNGPSQSASARIVSTALCVEPRHGRLHVFLPPTGSLEDFLQLVAEVERTAESTGLPVLIEGYLPPPDPRIRMIKVTPDPGVIEVNVQPAADWDELVAITGGVYEDARHTRLGTEKFQIDGRHAGTGGGNHVVLGGPTPADSPFLRRPDVLRSLLVCWNNHPSLSYLFSGLFIGPTSQAPRVDEGRQDALHELEIACAQVPDRTDELCPPWLVDRIFRHLLVDLTGNTHRAEFCIDKLYSPDSSTGRLGLVELRAFEMPPHAQMSLTQQLLVRALVARYWESPDDTSLVRWGTALHDRFMLPWFLEHDFAQVIDDLRAAGFTFEPEWFAPHLEFRCPPIGSINVDGVQLEIRQAIEPWYVLGEEPAGGSTARYVDSSVERIQVLVRGLVPQRHLVTCNGHAVPLHPTGTVGEYVAGVRYRAWQPPSCLHPTIARDTPLTFDIVDQFAGRAIGGCRYHIDHPGGLNPGVYPVNALEAESRRAARFESIGHSGGPLEPTRHAMNLDFPLTLDLRRTRTTL